MPDPSWMDLLTDEQQRGYPFFDYQDWRLRTNGDVVAIIDTLGAEIERLREDHATLSDGWGRCQADQVAARQHRDEWERRYYALRDRLTQAREIVKGDEITDPYGMYAMTEARRDRLLALLTPDPTT